MKKTPLIILVAVVAVAALIIIIWQVKTISGTSALEEKASVSTEIVIVFKANCARCHGDRGQGFGDKPAIQDAGYTAEEVKEIIKGGLDEMPSFPNISEPTLGELSEYASNL